MIVSLLLNVLAIPYAHAGLALATSLGALFNAALLLVKLRRERIYLPATGWGLFLLRIGLATRVMSVALYSQTDPHDWLYASSDKRALLLLEWIGIGLLLYGSTLWLTGMRTPLPAIKSRMGRSNG
ncbi:lipid II flippase MurJ [Methylomicrobium sp. RS1]|jgi:putative peptidoglycan lipid II flippase|uniref:lipid II flippase MurJ n=1 Tax=Candidatus Methylomicrobium oryzae TaxID=2802053 RepID=UPI001F2EBCE7|nr:lipid II flippase MurJ [Methylomicrobium sp. RS1]